MTIRLLHVELRKAEVRTRMPFRYGIATLTEVPYLLVFADYEIDGKPSRGIAADVLPPKWFTKQPDARLEDEIDEMLRVIRAAISNAGAVDAQPSIFTWWWELQQRQRADADLSGLPPLLTGFGTSLLERTAIDAFCRHAQVSMATAVSRNMLGVQLERIHPELQKLEPNDLLPTPADSLYVRHTVGLLDPLTDEEISEDDVLGDGLPQSLESCIDTYGLKLLKIKLAADVPAASERLRQIQAIIHRRGSEPPIRFTLDANEAFTNVEALHQYWTELLHQPGIREFVESRFIVLEQPLHRDSALSDATAQGLSTWAEGARPPIIIDESDGELHSLRRAIDAGYNGTSHKNCKGVFKGLANVCYLRWLQDRQHQAAYAWTGEDLMNLGPVALQQDLAIMAILGMEHVERNGHHYVAGLRHLPDSVQRSVLEHHGDLYRQFEPPNNGDPYPAVRIEEGRLALGSVLKSPFGYACDLPMEEFEVVN